MLSFDQTSHVYRWNGRIVPSVTQVLDPIQELEGVPRAVLEAAREFGSHVHLACHLFNKGTLREDLLDEALVPYLNDYKQFLVETGFKVRGSETPLYHKMLGYAGTPDLHGQMRLIDWVVDLKSGAVPPTIGPQTAAYQQLLEPRPRKRLCVQLTGHGYKLFEQKDLSDFALFQSCLNVHRFREKRKYSYVSESAA